MSEPTVIKTGHLCTGCGSWMPFESCGTYCKVRGKQEMSSDDELIRIDRDRFLATEVALQEALAQVAQLSGDVAGLRGVLEKIQNIPWGYAGNASAISMSKVALKRKLGIAEEGLMQCRIYSECYEELILTIDETLAKIRATDVVK